MRPIFERAAGAANMQERLAALGQLAAGLAHELNNPAAAARRSARELEATFETLHLAVDSFVNSGVEREEAADARAAAAGGAGAGCRPPSRWTSLTRSDREDALAERLEACGLDGYALAGPLVDACVDEAWLERAVRRRRARRCRPRWPGSSRAWRRATSSASSTTARRASRSSSARSRSTRTWTATTSARSTSTRASRRRCASSPTG